MKDYIADRVILLANYMIDTKATVRQAANQFGVSKSTVHKDICDRLPEINKNLSILAKQVLQNNKAERHIRGGKATKEKYLKKRNTF